jgi:hypothetical protein
VIAQRVQNREFVNKESSARAAEGGFDPSEDSVVDLTSLSLSSTLIAAAAWLFWMHFLSWTKDLRKKSMAAGVGKW